MEATRSPLSLEKPMRSLVKRLRALAIFVSMHPTMPTPTKGGLRVRNGGSGPEH